MLFRRAFLMLVTLLCLGGAARAAGGQPEPFGHAQLTIVTATGRHRFDVEVARTDAQKRRGLMFRRDLAPDAGMIFEYRQPTAVAMWMKNTLIPLDMLFVDAQGRIVNIAERAIPLSQDVIAAAAPVTAVIELNGGTAARLHIKPGDRVLSPFFGSAR